MISVDLSLFIAGALVGACLGVAIGRRAVGSALRRAARSRVVDIDGRAFLLTAIVPEPGRTTTIEITMPPPAGWKGHP